MEYAQPTRFEERQSIAAECVNRLRMSAPTLVDGMDNAVEQAFGAWPERLYVLSREGRVVYQGGKGPYGFNVPELEEFLTAYLMQ